MAFLDLDGVAILATLSLDNFSQLFELVLWKIDFFANSTIPVGSLIAAIRRAEA